MSKCVVCRVQWPCADSLTYPATPGHKSDRGRRRPPEDGGFIIIFDKQTLGAYVPRVWAVEKEAIKEMRDLLRIYPRGHEWRKRLCVRPASREEVLANMNEVM